MFPWNFWGIPALPRGVRASSCRSCRAAPRCALAKPQDMEILWRYHGDMGSKWVSGIILWYSQHMLTYAKWWSYGQFLRIFWNDRWLELVESSWKRILVWSCLDQISPATLGIGVIHGVNNGLMGEYLMIATRGHLASHFWRGWPSISPWEMGIMYICSSSKIGTSTTEFDGLL